MIEIQAVFRSMLLSRRFLGPSRCWRPFSVRDTFSMDGAGVVLPALPLLKPPARVLGLIGALFD